MKRLITNFDYKGKCWWCGNKSNLTAEHKYKQSDTKSLYGKPFKKGIRLIKIRTDDTPVFLQGASSKKLSFSKSLCAVCNNSKSQKYDIAYEMFVNYWLQNKSDIQTNENIDLYEVYGINWEQQFQYLSCYVVKHVCCRLVDNKIRVPENLIDFLNNETDLTDLKLKFKIKPYRFSQLEKEDKFIYLSELFLVKNYFHSLIKIEPTSVFGWYTINNLSIDFIVEPNIVNSSNTNNKHANILSIPVVDYKTFHSKPLSIKENNLCREVGKLIERLEIFPCQNRSQIVYLYSELKHKT